jgi:tripartite-type tricarboxylate transporter receptor subunit TctC
VGGIAHLGFVLLNSMAGTRMLHVPYKGSPLQTQATVSGETAMAFDSVAVMQPFIKAGRIRALAIGSPKRSLLLPEVPTVAEAGLPGYELTVWYGLFAPAATPREIVALLEREVVKALNGRGVKDEFAALGAEPVGSTGQELGSVVRRDMKKWTKVAQEAGVKSD